MASSNLKTKDDRENTLAFIRRWLRVNRQPLLKLASLASTCATPAHLKLASLSISCLSTALRFGSRGDMVATALPLFDVRSLSRAVVHRVVMAVEAGMFGSSRMHR